MLELLDGFFSSVWGKIIDLIKDPLIIVGGFLVTSIIIFLPKKYINLLRLERLFNQYGWIAGLVFVITGVFLLIFVISKIISWINKRIYYYKKKNRLKDLSFEEKKALNRFIYFQERTINFNLIDNNIIKSLANQGFVRYTSREGDPFAFPFTIKEWVYKYLNKNRNLVELTKEEVSELEKRRQEIRQDIRNR